MGPVAVSTKQGENKELSFDVGSSRSAKCRCRAAVYRSPILSVPLVALESPVVFCPRIS